MKRYFACTLAALLSAAAVIGAGQSSAQDAPKRGSNAEAQKQKEIERGGGGNQEHQHNQGDGREHHHHGGRDAALGIAAGAAALAIIGSSRRHRDYDEEDQCREWHYRCRDGSDWACGKFERNC